MSFVLPWAGLGQPPRHQQFASQDPEPCKWAPQSLCLVVVTPPPPHPSRILPLFREEDRPCRSLHSTLQSYTFPCRARRGPGDSCKGSSGLQSPYSYNGHALDRVANQRSDQIEGRKKQHKHKVFGPDFPRTFLTLTPECPGVKKFLPTTGAAGKRTFWCGRPRFSARTSMTRRVVEKLCAKKVCVDFLAPKICVDKYITYLTLVDVLDIFYFFFSGEGKGESGRAGGVGFY